MPRALLVSHVLPDALGGGAHGLARLRAWQWLRTLAAHHRVDVVCLADGPVHLSAWKRLHQHATAVTMEPSPPADWWRWRHHAADPGRRALSALQQALARVSGGSEVSGSSAYAVLAATHPAVLDLCGNISATRRGCDVPVSASTAATQADFACTWVAPPAALGEAYWPMPVGVDEQAWREAPGEEERLFAVQRQGGRWRWTVPVWCATLRQRGAWWDAAQFELRHQAPSARLSHDARGDFLHQGPPAGVIWAPRPTSVTAGENPRDAIMETDWRIAAALARGLAVITDADPQRQAPWRHGEHLLEAHHAQEWAELTRNAMVDTKLRQRLAHAGQTLVRERLSWRVHLPRWEAFLRPAVTSIHVLPTPELARAA